MAGKSGGLVIDGDGHVMEPPTLWAERMNRKRWGDRIPRYVPEEEAVYVGGVRRSGGREIFERIAQQAGKTVEEVFAITESLRDPGGYDPKRRVEILDRDGMDAAVLYPSSALFFGPADPIEALRDPPFVAACQRAYNEWISEFCQTAPDRLYGVATVPLQDPELAVAEAEHAVHRLGLRGVTIRPSPYVDELPLSHSVYDRFWAACQDLDVPVAVHPGVHVDTPGACKKFKLVHDDANLAITNSLVDETHGGSGLGQAVGNTADMIVTIGRLLMGGVCERFPKLRFLFLESGGGWCPTQLQRMDEQVELFTLERRWLKLLPSEYFKRQCYISFDPDEWNLAASAEYIGADRILWASDFPHPEYRPDVLDELREGIESLPEADQRKILGENAVTAYRLPLRAS